MAVGSNTFKGLAVPLNGESEIKQLHLATDILTLTGASSMAADYLVCRDSSGNEVFFIRQDGFVRTNVTTTASAFALDIRQASSSLTGFNCAGNFQNVLGAVSITNAQCYGLRVHFDASGATSIGGGREAALMLYMKANTSSAGASHSMIVCDDAGTKLHNWITFLNIGTCDGMIVTGPTDGAGTHGLRIVIDTTEYYIMLTSCDPR